MKDYLKLIRVKHYLKNLLIFFPLFFSSNLFKVDLLIKTILAFLSFSFACSIIYIINDINDKEKDKLHEKKKHRPIASGKISIKKAYATVFVLSLLSIICFIISKADIKIAIYTLIYIVINLFYSFGLKNIPLIDISILVSGFLIRVLYGGAIIDVEVSNWLYLTVISMAFYLVIGKRRNEITSSKKETRKVLKYYTKEFLDKNMYMFLALSIVFYSLWSTLGIDNSLFKYTSIFVILILMKYSLNVESDSLGDPIEVILSDKILILLGIIYALYCFTVLYIF